MKNMNFILKGLMKAGLMVALLLVGQSLVAQSITTQAGAFAQSNQTKGTVSGDFIAVNDAVAALKTEAQVLAGSTSGNEAENSLRSAYYLSVASAIQQSGDVAYGLNSSASYLVNLFTQFKAGQIATTEAEVFQDAQSLVSN